MENRIARTYRLRERITNLILQLADCPEFGNNTRVIEILVWNEARKRGLLKPENGKHDPCKTNHRRS